MEGTVKGITAIVGGIASFLFGGWDASLTALVVCVSIDYMSGVLAAAKEKRLDSNVGFWGLVRKMMMFALVAMAFQIDMKMSTGVYPAIAAQMGVAIPEGGTFPVLRDGSALWFMANEGLSILENARRLGLKIPPGIEQALKNVKKGSEQNGRYHRG